MVRDGRFARALKNSQLTCGDIITICETVPKLGLSLFFFWLRSSQMRRKAQIG
jgi:hypothetical protein